MTEKNRDPAGRFMTGRSGNPSGRPLASKMSREKLAKLEDEALRVLSEQLAQNDTGAATWILGRLIPPLRPVATPVAVQLPAGTLSERGEAILAELAKGTLGVDEAAGLIQALQAQCRLIEISEVIPMLEKLEGEP